MDETWKFYAKEKPDTKDHIIWLNLYEMPRIGKSIETKSRLVVCLRAYGKGKG